MNRGEKRRTSPQAQQENDLRRKSPRSLANIVDIVNEFRSSIDKLENDLQYLRQQNKSAKEMIEKQEDNIKNMEKDKQKNITEITENEKRFDTIKELEMQVNEYFDFFRFNLNQFADFEQSTNRKSEEERMIRHRKIQETLQMQIDQLRNVLPKFEGNISCLEEKLTNINSEGEPKNLLEKQIIKLQDLIGKADDTIAKIHSKFENIELECVDLRNKLESEKQEEIKLVKEKYLEYTQNLNDLRKQNEEFKKQMTEETVRIPSLIDEKKKQLKFHVDQANLFESRCNEIKNELENLDKQMLSLNEERNKLRSEIENNQENIAKEINEGNEFLEKISVAKAEIDKQLELERSLKQTLTEHEHKKEHLKETLDKILLDANNNSKLINQLKSKANELETKLLQKKSEIDAKSNEKNKYELNVEELKKKHAEIFKKAETAQELVSNKKDKIEELRRLLENQQSEKDDLKTMLEEYFRTIAEEKMRMEVMVKRFNDSLEKNVSLYTKTLNLDQETESLNSETSKIHSKRKELMEEIETANMKQMECKTDIKNLKQAIKDKKVITRHTVDKLIASEKAEAENNSKKEQELKGKVEQLTKSLNEKKASNELLLKKLEDYKKSK